MLMAYDGSYSTDSEGGRPGFSYVSRAAAGAALVDVFREVAVKTLRACAALEADAQLMGRVRFRTDSMRFFSNDRLLAPNNEGAVSELKEALSAFARELYPGAVKCYAVGEDARMRATVVVEAASDCRVDELLRRVSESTVL